MTPRDARSLAEIKDLIARSSGAALGRLIDELGDDDRVGVAAVLESARARQKATSAERRRLAGLYRLESDLAAQGFAAVAGIDEVGRGAIAGPLTACACILPASPRIIGVDDSKRLTPARREELALTIKEVAISWSVGHVSAAEIDSLGVTSALKRAMGRALSGLEIEPDHVLVDGLPMNVTPRETAVVKGDSKVAAIAAASIVAKVTRDALMVQLASEHPEYGFHINKGYGTAEHNDAIARHGLSPLHRRSFTPGGGTATLF